MSETNEQKKLKGIVVFFVNLYPDLGQDVKTSMNIYKEMSKPLIDGMTSDGRYVPIFAPVHKEATRIEKIDFDAPFPRFNPNTDQILKTLTKSKKSLFAKDEKFSGFITFFINFQPEVKLDVQETISFIKEMNAESLDLIAKDGSFTILIVPTTKEGSRVQKVDFNAPFPRFIAKTNTKKKKLLSTKVKNQKLQEDEYDEEDDDFDNNQDDDNEVEE